MNAPDVIERTADQGSRPALPFNLQPYAEGEFDKMHAAGSMLVSASSVAAIFNKIPQRYGKLCYARHLKGDQPLPNLDDIALIEAGHLLEPLAAKMLSKELGVDVVRHNAYSRHPWLPMFATPDGAAQTDDDLIIELKMVTPSVYWEHWRDGPPIHVGLQHQAQFACTGAKAGIIGVLSTGFFQLEFFETVPHQPTIERIELGVDSFMATIERGEMPDPDDTEADFEAFRQLMCPSVEGKTIEIGGEEAERRAQQFLQAKRDEAAATKTIEAHKRWFQFRIGDADIAKLDGNLEAHWPTAGRKSKNPNRRFSIKEAKGEDNG